jgi:hypothetical protein
MYAIMFSCFFFFNYITHNHTFYTSSFYALKSQCYHAYFLVITLRTYHWLDVIFHYDNELMINSYSHITKNLSVFRKVEVVQAVLILLQTVMLHEFLKAILSKLITTGRQEIKTLLILMLSSWASNITLAP